MKRRSIFLFVAATCLTLFIACDNGSSGGGGGGGGGAKQFAVIPDGCFDMGDAFAEGNADELPVHEVCISKFKMMKHEVTVGEYKDCVADEWCTLPTYLGSNARTNYYDDATGTYDDYPVIAVSWYDAITYCTWLGGRLPTEAEFEYAARGDLDGTRYPNGDAITCSDANYGRNNNTNACWDFDGLDNDTQEVGIYDPNGYGLHDMTGNVLEWVNDLYLSTYYATSPTNDPQGPGTGTTRVMRGGSWAYNPASEVRVANRWNFSPTDHYTDVGFRCAK